jgi:CheY-like chemotaxis protein
VRSFDNHPIASQIVVLSDGEAALDYLLRRGKYADPSQSPRPHMILLDLRLPRIDGLEVLKAIKESTVLRPIPVIVLTTSDADNDVLQAYLHYANSYVVKPVGYDQLVKLMRDLGSFWLGWNIAPRV